MTCAYNCMKWILFLLNFVFVLLGIAILAVGVYLHLQLTDYETISDIVASPSIVFIVIGVIIFVIAFFGCCGAIRESHCMVITYAVFLLTILIIQIAIGIWAFVLSKNLQTDTIVTEISTTYKTNFFVNYWTDEADRAVVDVTQAGWQCCGVTSYTDFNGLAGAGNNTIPWSCCGNEEFTPCTTNIYDSGCVSKIVDMLKGYAITIGAVLIGVAVTELIGIIFALCLANSIRNDDRRGYRV